MEKRTVILHLCMTQTKSKHVQGQRLPSSVHLLDGWAAATTWCTAHVVSWHSTFWHATTACGLIDFHHDRVDNPFKLLLFCLEFIISANWFLSNQSRASCTAFSILSLSSPSNFSFSFSSCKVLRIVKQYFSKPFLASILDLFCS